jgi:hypothetical protein
MSQMHYFSRLDEILGPREPESSRPLCSPNCREEFFSETQKAIREEKGRGVENPGGKVSWTLCRGRLIPSCPAY